MIRRSLIAAFATLTLAGAANASLIQNGDFDDSNVGYGGFLYGNGFTSTVAEATGWTFTNGSGILNNSWWGGSGTMAFLQNYSPFNWADPAISQTFTSNASSFNVSFQLRQRDGNAESVNVLLDGQAIAPTLQPVDSNWTSYSFDISGLTGSSHTLSFNGINLSSAPDSTLFVDGVSVTANAVPEPLSAALMLGGLGVMGWVRRRRT
jgi:hypothetical protein